MTVKFALSPASRPRLRTFAMLIALASATLAQAAEPQSLLSNGDFSQPAAGYNWPDDWPHDWPADWPRPEGVTWEKQADLHFLRLHPIKPGQSALVYRQVHLPAPLPPALEIQLRVRHNDISPAKDECTDARITMTFKDDAGREIPADPLVARFHGTSDGWVDWHATTLVPPNALDMDLAATLLAPGTGTFDWAQAAIFPLPNVPTTQTAQPRAAKIPTLHITHGKLLTDDATAIPLPRETQKSLSTEVPVERHGPVPAGVSIFGYGQPTVWFIKPYADTLGHNYELILRKMIAEARNDGHVLAVGIAARPEQVDPQIADKAVYIITYKAETPLPTKARRMIFLNAWLNDKQTWDPKLLGPNGVAIFAQAMPEKYQTRWKQIAANDDPTFQLLTTEKSRGNYMGDWPIPLKQILWKELFPPTPTSTK